MRHDEEADHAPEPVMSGEQTMLGDLTERDADGNEQLLTSIKVKAPAGMDADDAEVAIDGKDVEADSGVRVLAVEHALVATLDGCKPVRKVISIDEADGTKTVKINFKKEEAPKAESDDAE